jgi:hypothetical protein
MWRHLHWQDVDVLQNGERSRRQLQGHHSQVRCYALTVSSAATDPTASAALRTQVGVLLRLIAHMIVAQKAAVDAHPGLKDITRERIYAEEIAA